jgi:hypothetical protein
MLYRKAQQDVPIELITPVFLSQSACPLDPVPVYRKAEHGVPIERITPVFLLQISCPLDPVPVVP